MPLTRWVVSVNGRYVGKRRNWVKVKGRAKRFITLDSAQREADRLGGKVETYIEAEWNGGKGGGGTDWFPDE